MRRKRNMQDVSSKQAKKIINDRLSSLPEALQVHILGFLDTKQAVQTSLLSKQWVNLWTLLSDFDFISSGKSLRSFDGTIEKLLSLRDDSVMINSFAFSHKLNDKNLERVLDFVSSHRVQNVTKICCYGVQNRLCSFDFLRNLKLQSAAVDHLLGLKQVDTLDFERFRFNDSEDFSGCPNLKSLTLKDCRSDLVVVAPKLSRLNISCRNYWGHKNKLVLSTPSLTFFECSRNGSFSIKSGDMPLLETIDMDIGFPYWHSTWTRKLIAMLKGFPAAKVLRLSSSTLKPLSMYPDILAEEPSPFCNLKVLKVGPNATSAVTTYLLGKSPNATIVVE